MPRQISAGLPPTLQHIRSGLLWAPGRGDRVGSDADKVALVVRRPLPATCPDCGADVLAHADIEGPGAAGPAGVQRDADPEGAAMTLRFIVAVRDQVPVGEEAPA